MRQKSQTEIRKATAIGGIALPVWSTLAILTTASGDIPPLQLVAMAFGIAFCLGILILRQRRIAWTEIRAIPLEAWVIGVGGLFGYHFLYFLAFRLAPAVEVNLLNYLWPLLIVLFSAWILRETVLPRHVVGALLGLAGSALIVTRGGRLAIQSQFLGGYLAALGAALVWASYSVLSRRLRQIPSEMVGIFCGMTALLSIGAHLIFEQTVHPDATQWALVLGMGLGPVGSAFFFWDYGMKRGDIRALGVASYIIPFLSTAWLILFGEQGASGYVWIAGLLIVLGAVVAGREVLRTN